MKAEEEKIPTTVTELAQELGRMGGLARARKLSKHRRQEISRVAGSAPKRKQRPRTRKNRPRTSSRKVCLNCKRQFLGQGNQKWCSEMCKAASKST